MRTPGELFAEGECDEMALGQLAVFDDETAAEIREIIDRYAEEIYDDGEDDED